MSETHFTNNKQQHFQRLRSTVTKGGAIPMIAPACIWLLRWPATTPTTLMDDNRIGWQGDQLWRHKAEPGFADILIYFSGSYASHLFPPCWHSERGICSDTETKWFHWPMFFFDSTGFVLTVPATAFRALLRGGLGPTPAGKIGDLVSLFAEKFQPSRQHFDPGISFSLWVTVFTGLFPCSKLMDWLGQAAYGFGILCFAPSAFRWAKGKDPDASPQIPHYDPSSALGSTNLHLLLR